jgi:hypothetical protein
VVECLTEADVLTLSIEHGHRSHEEVLDALGGALWEAGWTFAESKITELVDEAVEQAVVFGLGGGVAGATTRNEAIVITGVLAGAAAGFVAGSRIRKVGAEFRATWVGNGWQIIKLPTRAPAQAAVQVR